MGTRPATLQLVAPFQAFYVAALPVRGLVRLVEPLDATPSECSHVYCFAGHRALVPINTVSVDLRIFGSGDTNFHACGLFRRMPQ
ncbi:MAG: hypothetical protein QOK23_1899 [Gammaproteobacteria bacterium]|jgi:hypothetical protein|nr:hypothetical protein [Gammaproteobacteria bacterium]